jgi:hypothetical protein
VARDLNIRITADNSDANAKLGQTEQAITGVEQSGKKADKSIQGLGAAFGLAKKAIGVLGIGVTVFEFMSLSSQIQDTADRLGVGVEAIQRWKFAAEQSGGSLEGLTSAATFLMKGLGSGNEGVVGALEELGLKLEDVRAMRPEQAFELIADRVGKIPDPMKQVSLGAALMGRGFADNLPAMKQGLVALGNQAQELGLVMDETAIKAGDEFGDTLDQLKGAFMALIGTALKPILPILTELLQAVLPIVKVLAELLNLVLTPLGYVLQKVAEGIGWVVEKVTALLKPTEWIRKAWEGLVYVFETARDAIVDTAKKIYEGVNYWLFERFGDTVRGVKGLIGAVDSVYKQLWLNVVGRSYIPDMIDAIAAEFARLPRVMVQPAVQGAKQVDQAFQNLGQDATLTTKQFITQGLGPATSAFTQFGLAGSRASSAVAAGIQQMIQGIQQLAAATTAMQAYGGWMTIFSAAYSLAVEAMSRDTRQAAVDAQHWADALRDVGAAIEELGAEAPSIEELVAAGFGAGGWAGPLAKFSSGNFSRDQLMQFMQFYQRLAEEGSFPWEKMEEAAKKYGIALDQLGPKFSQAKFIAPLREMVSEWRLLVENGANAEAVALGMKDKLIAATQEAIKFGFALPNGLKPALRILFDMGLLLDENGEQLRDFSQLEFAPTIEDSLKDLVEIFKDLVDVLSAQLPRAAARAEDALGRLAPPRLWPGPGAGDGGTGGRVPDSNLAPETAAYATVGAASIVINNPQFNDRASINHLTARIEQTMMSRMTQRGTRFVR